ncbi:hypothetical protein B9T62_17955 [Paenibacillus donghaensis]|uniref:Uncharacterized protein n=1 Tax=Paenibacillus donghaensis TaxID=414771 RepID=A0A2Z2KH48_9BACL|nr:hypothetical protein B9T62_17955 [Paenibacillus donghaensis]
MTAYLPESSPGHLSEKEKIMNKKRYLRVNLVFGGNRLLSVVAGPYGLQGQRYGTSTRQLIEQVLYVPIYISNSSPLISRISWWRQLTIC